MAIKLTQNKLDNVMANGLITHYFTEKLINAQCIENQHIRTFITECPNNKLSRFYKARFFKGV